MNDEFLQKVRRYLNLTSLRSDQTVNTLTYAMAIEPRSGCSARDQQEVIPRERRRSA